MRLNHPGVYRIIGDKFELLANITGEAPMLSITNALLINDLVIENKWTILEKDSLEIQQVLNNPDAFIFIEYEYSEIAQIPQCKQSIRGTKMPRITDDEMNLFIQKYIQDRKDGRSSSVTRAFIMERTDFTLAQINVLMLQLAKICKNGSSLSHK